MPNTKTLTWVVIAAVVALLGLSLAYVIFGQPASAPSAQNTEQAPPPATTDTAAEPAKPGAYVEYSQAALDQADPSVRKILFFHASWCPQCRMLEKDINEQGVPSGMTIFKVNYDNSAQLKQKYGVTLQTTFVEVDAQGNLVKKHVAYSQPTLQATLKALGE